jgi:hypothetical protein
MEAPLNSEFILPHHTFDGLVWLSAVFRIFLLVVGYFNRSFYREVDQLPDRHAFVHFNRLFYRNLKGPVTAETNIALASCGMDVNAKATGRGFSFEEGDMRMGFRIFLRYAEVKNMRI